MRRLSFIILSVLIGAVANAQIPATGKVGLNKIKERFLSYVQIESQSVDDPDMSSFPITEGQKTIARHIYSGQNAEHSNQEWCCVEELMQLVDVVENMIKELTNR